MHIARQTPRTTTPGPAADARETRPTQHHASPARLGDALDIPPSCPLVAAVLERGVTDRFYLFPENNAARRMERWCVPTLASEGERRAVRTRLAILEQALAPAGRGELLARVLALLSHYRIDAHPAAVEMRIADDWAEDLFPFPMWAVEAAARTWRRTRKFKPQICEVLELCQSAVGQLALERARLQQIADRAEAVRNPLALELEALASQVARRLTAPNGH